MGWVAALCCRSTADVHVPLRFAALGCPLYHRPPQVCGVFIQISDVTAARKQQEMDHLEGKQYLGKCRVGSCSFPAGAAEIGEYMLAPIRRSLPLLCLCCACLPHRRALQVGWRSARSTRSSAPSTAAAADFWRPTHRWAPGGPCRLSVAARFVAATSPPTCLPSRWFVGDAARWDCRAAPPASAPPAEEGEVVEDDRRGGGYRGSREGGGRRDDGYRREDRRRTLTRTR